MCASLPHRVHAFDAPTPNSVACHPPRRTQRMSRTRRKALRRRSARRRTSRHPRSTPTTSRTAKTVCKSTTPIGRADLVSMQSGIMPPPLSPKTIRKEGTNCARPKGSRNRISRPPKALPSHPALSPRRQGRAKARRRVCVYMDVPSAVS